MLKPRQILSLICTFMLCACTSTAPWTDGKGAQSADLKLTHKPSSFVDVSDDVIAIKPLNNAQQATKEKVLDVAIMVSPLPPAARASAPQAEDTISVAPIPKTSWTLTAGHTIGQDLKTWAASDQWHVIWNISRDWAIPANTVFAGDFPTAATEVIKTLAANGALIKAQIYQGNRTLVINGPGTPSQ